LDPSVSLTRFDLRGDRDGFGLDVESEGRNGSRADPGRSSFDGQFDVVRIVFQAAHDHDVLEPPRDEELAVLKKAEIASSKEGALESVRKVSPKAGASLVRRRQHPRATLSLMIQISPTSLCRLGSPVAGSTISMRVVASPTRSR
jgi:hypothetical protein